MIRYVELLNWQKHRRLRIDFDPITTFVGPSDSGKSAILRALRYVCLNKIGVRKFCTWGTEKARVRLGLEKGVVVSRQRGPGATNTYRLGKRTFKAFGAQPPAEVAAVLNVDELSFHRQIESPFWFTTSAGEVSKNLNKIVDLGSIDTTLHNLSAELRKTSAEVVFTDERLTIATGALVDLRWARKADRDLRRVEREQAANVEEAVRASRLGLLVDEALRARDLSRTLRRACRDLEKVLRLAETAHQVGEDVLGLQVAVADLREAQAAVEAPVPDLGPVERRARNLITLEERTKALRALVYRARLAQETIKECASAHKKIGDRLYREMGEKCPLCGSNQDLPF